MLSLVSQVATTYFELLELDEELVIAHRATESFGDSLKLFNERLAGGIASRLGNFQRRRPPRLSERRAGTGP